MRRIVKSCWLLMTVASVSGCSEEEGASDGPEDAGALSTHGADDPGPSQSDPPPGGGGNPSSAGAPGVEPSPGMMPQGPTQQGGAPNMGGGPNMGGPMPPAGGSGGDPSGNGGNPQGAGGDTQLGGNPGVGGDGGSDNGAMGGTDAVGGSNAVGGASGSGGSEPTGPQCGDGLVEGGEECDGEVDVTCTDYGVNWSGTVSCTDCRLDQTTCASPDDMDLDGVNDAADPAPDDSTVCGDVDSDGCDDCSINGTQSPDEDGYDYDEDGECEIAVDYDCMNGANAPLDPYRLQACTMLTLMNLDRVEFVDETGTGGVITWNEEIWEVAIAHSMDMCERGYFAHDNPEGQNPGARLAAAGLDFSWSENIAINWSPNAAHFAWMNEPTCEGHRGAILAQQALEVGIGYHVCEDAGDPDWEGAHYATADFRFGNGGSSSYCQAAATACEVPPDPISLGGCYDVPFNNDFCEPITASEVQNDWGCAND